MPCQGPTPAEWKRMQEYEEKMKDPIFKEKEERRIAKAKFEWENGGKQKWEKKLKKEEEKELKEEKDYLLSEIKKGNLENIAFNSFMSVFLCKAIELLVSNDLLKHAYGEMEWWWDEHQYRDKNNNKSSLTKEEIYKKLLKMNNYYRVK